MKKDEFAVLLRSWSQRQLLRIHLKEATEPLKCKIVAFGKTGFIDHFDVISVIESSSGDDLNYDMPEFKHPIREVAIKDIVEIEILNS